MLGGLGIAWYEMMTLNRNVGKFMGVHEKTAWLNYGEVEGS
jgi:hypothetical protein